MSDWREQLRNNFSYGKKMIADLHEILRHNPNIPLSSVLSSMQRRGHKRATRKNTKNYMEKDPKIGKKIDTSKIHGRPTVYFLKED